MMPIRSKLNFPTIFIAVLAAGLLGAAPGGGQPVEQATINYIEAAAVADQFVNEVRAYVTVSTTGQKPVSGLTTGDFKAFEDGRPVTLAGVSATADPMAVVLVIDTSGSMQASARSGRTSMDAAKNAAADFIKMLAPGDRLALFSFNMEPRLHSDFSVDHGAVIAAVNGLAAKANAYTCLYDTAFRAVQKAAEIPRGRRAVILLTDGRDEKADGPCSTHNVSDVIDLATTQTIRVPIYTIGVGPKVDAKDLGRMAGLTGGRSLLAASPEQLQGFYQTLADQLKNQYLLRYHSQAASGEHSLVIKVQHQGKQGQDEKRFWVPPLPVSQPPTVQDVKSGKGVTIPLAALLVLILAAAGGGVWWFRRRQPYNPEALQPITPSGVAEGRKNIVRDKEDETFFVGQPGQAAKGSGITATRIPAATLTVVESSNLDSGKTFDLGGTTSIGRGDDNDILIPDKAISRRHAEIYFDVNRFFIRDLGSKYGTKVDGRDVTSGRLPLSEAAQVQLGPRTILKFHVPSPPATDDNTKTKRYDLGPDEKTQATER